MSRDLSGAVVKMAANDILWKTKLNVINISMKHMWLTCCLDDMSIADSFKVKFGTQFVNEYCVKLYILLHVIVITKHAFSQCLMLVVCVCCSDAVWYLWQLQLEPSDYSDMSTDGHRLSWHNAINYCFFAMKQLMIVTAVSYSRSAINGFNCCVVWTQQWLCQS